MLYEILHSSVHVTARNILGKHRNRLSARTTARQLTQRILLRRKRDRQSADRLPSPSLSAFSHNRIHMGTLLGKDASGISFYPILKGHSFDYRGPESKLYDEAGIYYRG